MKLNRFCTTIIFLTLALNLAAQPAPDLVLTEDITVDYINYLVNKEANWLVDIYLGVDEEAVMRAHMGLAIMAFAWSHVDGDTMITELEPVMESIDNNLIAIGDRIGDDIIPILDPFQINAVIPALTDFFNNGDYVAFRDFMDLKFDELDTNFNDFGTIVDEFFSDLDFNFTNENFSSHIDSIFNSTADFSFALQVLAADFPDTTFIFDRVLFDHIEDLQEIGDEIGNNFDQFGSWMDSVMAITGGDVMPGIAHLRTGLNNLSELLDTLQVILTTQPFGPFEIDTAPIDSIQEGLTELDLLLAGEEYQFGPEAEGKTIKPLAIIQNLPGDGLPNIYWDFYRSTTPAAYIFGGIFPYGLDSETLGLLSPDVIVNNWDNENDFDLRLDALQAMWSLKLGMTDPTDPDAHLGLALIQTFELINDQAQIIDDIFYYLDAGRIDSLTYYYDWEAVNFLDDLDMIDEHLSYFTDADRPAHFVALVKTADDGLGRYIIGPASEFEIINIPVPLVQIVQIQLAVAKTGIELVIDGVSALYAELDDIFILDLDPTVLDFSTVESDTDLVQLLELSNPAFLTLTPLGVQRFIEAGDMLEEGLAEINEFFALMTDLARAMQPYETDFDMDGLQFIADMEEMDDATYEVWQDFAYPDSVTIIDGERTNLSAWFDNPPASFLVMWKNFILGTDSTLGGVFPDRYKLDIVPGGLPALPRSFVVRAAYPNPFNPVTWISFDLPQAGAADVSVYNLLGVKVATLLNREMSAGYNLIPWNAASQPSGVYFYRVTFENQSRTHKVMLLK
ncbi:MAG: T9SS type A sorting domain-containing protein [Candidatus Neomarinimicrobiota bacterium]